MSRAFNLALFAALAGWSALATAAEPDRAGGRINNLKILSDKIDDVTTVENVLKSFSKPKLTDQEKSLALWRAAVRYRHQTSPPNEFLAGDWEAHDPVKIFNVYGYCMCCCSSSLIEALNRADGREARGRILNGHSVPEVRYRGGWHMFDASLITNFPRPSDGVIASVDEIAGVVAAWYGTHPEFHQNGAKLVEVMRKNGWMGWKADGPPLLAHCPYYRMGYFPARTHGWDATMIEYDRKPEIYEYGSQSGHKALFSLRPGESFVRESGHRGLHVNMDQDPNWDGLTARAPENDLAYVKEFVPGYRGGVVGNGVHRYAPNLAAGDLALGAEVYDNLSSGGSPALRVKDAGKPGVAVFAMASPYVYLGGKLRIKTVGKSANDRVAVTISTNNGRTFAPLVAGMSDGPFEAVVDLKEKIFRRYAYWLKLEISAATAAAGVVSFVVENDFQHAPRTVPRLERGKNTITVAADSDPTIASRAIACRITADPSFSKNETTATMGISFENLKVDDGSCWWKGEVGRMTVPAEVPGDLVALRLSVQYRARGVKDLIKIKTSADDGKSWREADRIIGPTQGATRQFRLADWPPGARKALVQFEMTGDNTVGLLNFRIDADYRDPVAAPSFRPFQVVHRWEEAGRLKSRDATIARLPAIYEITTAADPEMFSVTYEMPASR